MKYIIYTDGACSGNPGPGGWGAVILENEKDQKSISGYVNNTTNNRISKKLLFIDRVPPINDKGTEETK